MTRAWIEKPWALLSVAAVLLWPSSLLGYVKAGGALNSFLPTIYFLTCASLLLLASNASATGGELAASRRVWLPVLVLVALATGLQVGTEAVVRAGRLGKSRPDSEAAFKALKGDSDRVLFPWFPLSARLATGQFAHSELGIRERELAGLQVTADQIRQGVPRNLRYIVCGRDTCESTLRHFDVLKETPVVNDSGRWTVYEVRAGVAH
jgi:hypothetical protein